MRLAVSAGIAPRRLTGWEPAGEPEWDEIDVCIIRAWGDLQETLCVCGRPRSVHLHDKPADYQAGFFTCTAVQMLDTWQRDWHEVSGSLPKQARADALADKRAREAGLNPDRARTWFTFTTDEGPPT